MSTEVINVAEIFGENVFNDTVMQERLPKKVYKNLRKTIEEGKDLDLETADVIAHEMKEWAIVKIGGVDIREIPQGDLMKMVAFVFQDPKLFKDSLLENIRAGRPSATREEVLKAAHLAQCDDILKKLPNGIDTIIGSQGIYLSGGETQRISIARAILKDAPIVVLDEATAYADPENEHQIQKAFDGLIKNKTVIMVAHRLSTVQDADQILVMKNGAIAESGTHSDLIKHQGEYAKMWDNYNKTVQWHIES